MFIASPIDTLTAENVEKTSPAEIWTAEPTINGFWQVVNGQSVVVAQRCVEEEAKLIAAAPKLLRELKIAAMFFRHLPMEVIEQAETELDCGLGPENILSAIDEAEGR
jgi:hypothetical protein